MPSLKDKIKEMSQQEEDLNPQDVRASQRLTPFTTV